MYQNLSKYYDELVKDETATKLWVDFVLKHGNLGNILEVAAGTGEISIALAHLGYQILATDISEMMLKEALKKPGAELVKFKKEDMLEINYNQEFDNVICFCDSLNYLTSLHDVEVFFKQAFQTLKTDGKLLLDILSIDRLKELQDPFIEEGQLSAIDYQWVIETHQNQLYHYFTFWIDDDVINESHLQTVYDYETIKLLLNEIGFEVEVYTDFINKGIQTGERYCLVAKKII